MDKLEEQVTVLIGVFVLLLFCEIEI